VTVPAAALPAEPTTTSQRQQQQQQQQQQRATTDAQQRVETCGDGAAASKESWLYGLD
jgi:hypothetical protein